jgi:hypothetical protein
LSSGSAALPGSWLWPSIWQVWLWALDKEKTMNIWDILILAVIAGIVILAYRSYKKGDSCCSGGSSCSGCASRGSCGGGASCSCCSREGEKKGKKS